MSIIVPRVFLLIIFLIFCLLIHLAEKVCASPLINPLSVSKGLLDLPAQSLFLWLGRRYRTNNPNSSGNHLQPPFKKKKTKDLHVIFQSASSLILCCSVFSFFLCFVLVLFIVQRFDPC